MRHRTFKEVITVDLRMADLAVYRLLRLRTSSRRCTRNIPIIKRHQYYHLRVMDTNSKPRINRHIKCINRWATLKRMVWRRQLCINRMAYPRPKLQPWQLLQPQVKGTIRCHKIH